MCAELTAADQARIVIPIVFRNEYQTPSGPCRVRAVVTCTCGTLAYAWRWTSGMPWSDRATVDGYLVADECAGRSTDAGDPASAWSSMTPTHTSRVIDIPTCRASPSILEGNPVPWRLT